jgi:hypothetical protein
VQCGCKVVFGFDFVSFLRWNVNVKGRSGAVGDCQSASRLPSANLSEASTMSTKFYTFCGAGKNVPNVELGR